MEQMKQMKIIKIKRFYSSSRADA
eukprot:SAG31_NODE_11803_length_996_cov_6.113712_1_plen_23_part_01